MKKLNNRGVTLVELIVSFALVGVAIISFFQTLNTVNELYKKSKDETNDYVRKNYTFKLAKANIDKGKGVCNLNEYCKGAKLLPCSSKTICYVEITYYDGKTNTSTNTSILYYYYKP